MRFLPQRLFCGITNPLRFPHWGVGTRGARGVVAPIHIEKRGLRNYGLGDCRRRPDEQQRWHPDGHRGRDGRDALPPVGRATLRLHPRQRARARSAVADGLWAAAARLRRLHRLGPGARLHRGLRARGDPAHVRQHAHVNNQDGPPVERLCRRGARHDQKLPAVQRPRQECRQGALRGLGRDGGCQPAGGDARAARAHARGARCRARAARGAAACRLRRPL